MVTKVVRLDHGEENRPGSGEPLLTPGDGNSQSPCAVLHPPYSVLTYINQQSLSFTERSLAPMTLSSDFSSLYFKSDHSQTPPPHSGQRASSWLSPADHSASWTPNQCACGGGVKGGKKPRSALKKEMFATTLISNSSFHHNALKRIISPFFSETVLFSIIYSNKLTLNFFHSSPLILHPHLLLYLPKILGTIRKFNFHFLSPLFPWLLTFFTPNQHVYFLYTIVTHSPSHLHKLRAISQPLQVQSSFSGILTSSLPRAPCRTFDIPKHFYTYYLQATHWSREDLLLVVTGG